MYSRVCAKIHLEALEKNLASMKANLQPQTKMIGVIKADAYGHGAGEIARYMAGKDYVWGFATATVDEAVHLREEGISHPLLILGYTFPEDYERMALMNIRPTVFTVEMALQMAEAARRMGKTMKIHLSVDTGMSRIGLFDDERGVEAACEIAKMEGLEIEGPVSYTHLRAHET